MDIILSIILIFIVLQLSLHLSFFDKKEVMAGYLIVTAIFVYLAYPYAIEESYKTIKATMNNDRVITNFIGLTIFENTLILMFSIVQLELLFNSNPKKIWKYVKYFTGIAFLISVYYTETLLFINIQGFDFQVLAIIIALIIPSVMLLLKQAIKWLVPENYLRIELKFFVSLTLIFLSVILSIIVTKTPVNTSPQSYDFKPLILSITSAIILIIIGYIYNIFKTKKTWK